MPSHHDRPEIAVRAMQRRDADQVLTIYQHGLDTGHAGFETTAPTWEEFDAAKLDRYRYVATDRSSRTVLGWIAASPVSDRCCYAGVVEHSIYVSPDARGLGHRLRTAGSVHRRPRGRRHLEDPDPHLPREHAQSPPAREGGLSHGRHPPKDRPPTRPLARRPTTGAPKPHRPLTAPPNAALPSTTLKHRGQRAGE